MSGTHHGPSGQNPYDPRPYVAYAPGQVPYGPPPDHPEATKVLILGVLGFALCQVLSPFAWVTGSRVRREIAASGGRVGGDQIVTIGWVLGIAGSIIAIVGLLALVGYVVVIALAVGSSL